MSIAIETSRVSQAMRKKINLELPIKLENNKYNKLAPPTFVYPFRDDGERTVLPFSYATKVLKIPRPLRSDFTQTDLKFDAKLRPEQIEVKNEASDLISKHGSVIVSAFCGFGKCLGYNTPVMLVDGSVIPVQDIVSGQQLMGDDSTPRNVLSICRGEEQMYRIIPKINFIYISLI